MRRFAEIDSTNSYLLGEARLGAPEGLVAVADVQRAGRGRLDRTWDSPAGASLLVSILLRPCLAVDRLHLAVAAAAVAAAEACAEVAGIRPGLKWPNDLVVGPSDRKLGGILSETHLPPAIVGPGDPVYGAVLPEARLPAASLAPGAAASGAVISEAHRPAVVVGLGLNVDWPAGTVPPGAAALGLVDRDMLLEAILAHLGRRYGQWSGVAKDYRSACVTIGRQVRVQLAGETVTGTAVDISDAGHLVVSTTTAAGTGTDDSLRTIAAGDVVHLRPDAPD